MAIDFFDNEMEKLRIRFEEVYQGKRTINKQEFASGLLRHLTSVGLARGKIRKNRSRTNIQDFMRRKEDFHFYLNRAEIQFKRHNKKPVMQESKSESIAN